MKRRCSRSSASSTSAVSCPRNGQKGNACRLERQSIGSRLNTCDAREVVRVQLQYSAVQPHGLAAQSFSIQSIALRSAGKHQYAWRSAAGVDDQKANATT